MQLSVPLFIALRYWRAKSADRFGKLVTNLASIGIVLGVIALIIVLSVMNGLESHQKQSVLSSVPHAMLMLPEENINSEDKTPEMPSFVHKVVPINSTNVILQTAASVTAGQVIGIKSGQDDPLLEDFFIGKTFADYLPEGEFKILISQVLANKLKVSEGDKVRLMITQNSQYTPFGRVPMQRLFKISGIYQSDRFDDSASVVFTNLADIGRLMRIQPTEFQAYRLFLDDPFQITQLPQFFPENKWKLADWRSQKGEFFQAVRMEKNMMGLLISLIIVVAISNIITSLSLMVVDKQGEIAILQTQGFKKSQVRWVFILQGFLVGLVGTLLGTVLGILITFNLQSIVDLINQQRNAIYLPTLIEPMQIITIVVFSLLLSFLSTIYPAYRAAKVEPAEALRYE